MIAMSRLLALIFFKHLCIKKLIEKGESNDPQTATTPQNHGTGTHPNP
jgi:hypothetical protein